MEEMEEIDYLYGFNNVCFYSSSFFIINISIALQYEDYICTFLFACLLITSYTSHYTQNQYIILLDKTIIGFIVLYGGYQYMNKTLCYYDSCNDTCNDTCNDSYKLYYIYFILISFFLVCYLYLTGIAINPIVVCDIKGNWVHCFIHLIGSIAHALIIIL